MKSLKAKFRKTDVNEWNKNDERLLAAVEHGEVEKVASLVAKKGASPIKLDSEGKSALHLAASRGHIDCLAVLLSHGADPTVADAAGLNPLHLAAKNNHAECCKRLIQSKCPVDSVDSSGRSALHHAALGGKIQTVQFLCELKSAVNLKDADGHSPLLLAAKHGHAEVCITLLDCGAEISTSDNSGRTALMLATESNAVAVVEVLVHRGAILSAADFHGRDVLHYAKMSANCEVKAALTAALTRQLPDAKSPISPAHDQVAKLSDERITTPKKRKAPPPPISPLQRSGASSPSVSGTPSSNKSDTPKRFNYKDDEAREDDERLRNNQSTMLLETMDDSTNADEMDPKVEPGVTPSAALVSALQAKITALTLENQQLASNFKKHPSLQANEDLKETSRPDSMTSNSSFHSTRDDLELAAAVPSTAHAPREDGIEEEGIRGSQEETRLLRQALENVQMKLLETRKENHSLQALINPERSRETGEEGSVRGKAKEEELIESLAELQAKLTDTQERYHQAVEEVEELRSQMGSDLANQRRASALEQEVKQLKAQLAQTGCEHENATQRLRHLEEALRRTEEESRSAQEKETRMAKMEEMYKEAQDEIRMLQEALRGTVPVEAAAKDFEEMKSELNEVICGLQRRLLELSHSYSETRAQLGATQKQLAETGRAPSPPPEELQLEMQNRLEEMQTLLADTEKKYSAALEEISQLRQEAEVQAQSSVALADHAQVMSSLGNAIKQLESQSEELKEQLRLKTLQLDALQNRLATEKETASADSISGEEHSKMREQLEGEVNHLTQLLQEALRKQDEMALEAADAWQKARDNRAEREAIQEVLTSREKENQSLTSKLAESQDAVCQLKQLVENHVASEREKNKRIDDLSREVAKLKDALNSLSQLSYSSGSPSKRQQQNQQLETMQQQVKQLQYQLAESKKQHNEIVSVYRMHLLYAVQGQMDEDVQKALKQILMMCKVPSQTKEAC
ncbi:ankycorbin isoform X1 [Hippocampus comes]|uniref:Retinoic acid induced 14 n=1 Tax=Hippocampus comes TaxID=109280 RepID=A0A3Q2XD55_HIPCM|nr:PREDICTED: ankycorbin isoform X1 [Hippocampus comes]XP_019727562.1 PREDICTED: ankycorbin isoform X1 [Hippocampus comes]XP_019727563.1 PREDICTED: ankycorbin isoform X1 [Hippocampus comes]